MIDSEKQISVHVRSRAIFPWRRAKAVVSFDGGYLVVSFRFVRRFIDPKEVLRRDHITLSVNSGFWQMGWLTLTFDSQMDADGVELELRKLLPPENLSRSFTSDSRDQRLHEIIRELCAQLGIQRSYKLVWADRVTTMDSGRGPKVIGSDECYIQGNQIILPMRMRRQLEPEEWRPIIAAALVLRSKLRRRVYERILTRLVLPPLVAIIIALVLIAQSDSCWSCSYAGPSWVVGLLTGGLFSGLLIPSFIYGYYFESAKLVADNKVAELVGRQRFLDVLMKIDKMRLTDEEKAKGRHFGTPRLGIDRRIKNLQDTSSENF